MHTRGPALRDNSIIIHLIHSVCVARRCAAGVKEEFEMIPQNVQHENGKIILES